MTLFEITIAGRRFSVSRELDCHDGCHQTYFVDGREVPVRRYLALIAMAVPAMSMHGDLTFVSSPLPRPTPSQHYTPREGTPVAI